jgi:transcriptional regulator with XRE-family HTH domain
MSFDEFLADMGNSVRAARESQELTVRTLCKQLDTETTNHRNIEAGRRAVSLKKLFQIANALDCDLNVSFVPRKWGKG